MKLSNASRADLHWWINSADKLHKPIALPKPDAILFTDASNQGWGGVLGEHRSGANGLHLKPPTTLITWKYQQFSLPLKHFRPICWVNMCVLE